MNRDRRSRNRRANDAYGTKQIRVAETEVEDATWATKAGVFSSGSGTFSQSKVQITSAKLLDNDVDPSEDVGLLVNIRNDNDEKAECDVDVLISGAYSGKLTRGTNPPANGSWRVSKHFTAPMSGGSYTISVRLSNVRPA